MLGDDRAVERGDDRVGGHVLVGRPGGRGAARGGRAGRRCPRSTPRMRSRWAASITVASACLTCWSAIRLLLVGVEPDLLERRLELRLRRLAGVLGDERRVLADDLLLVQLGRLLLLVRGDLELGVGREQVAPVGPERLVGVLLLEVCGRGPLAELRGSAWRRWRRPRPSTPPRPGPSPARAGGSRRLSRAVPTSGLSRTTSGVALLDLLAEQDRDLADDARGPGPDLDPAVGFGLDPPGDADLGRQLDRPDRLDPDPGRLELPLGQHDRRGRVVAGLRGVRRRLGLGRRRPRRTARGGTAGRGSGWRRPPRRPPPATRPRAQAQADFGDDFVDVGIAGIASRHGRSLLARGPRDRPPGRRGRGGDGRRSGRRASRRVRWIGSGDGRMRGATAGREGPGVSRQRARWGRLSRTSAGASEAREIRAQGGAEGADRPGPRARPGRSTGRAKGAASPASSGPGGGGSSGRDDAVGHDRRARRRASARPSRRRGRGAPGPAPEWPGSTGPDVGQEPVPVEDRHVLGLARVGVPAEQVVVMLADLARRVVVADVVEVRLRQRAYGPG